MNKKINEKSKFKIWKESIFSFYFLLILVIAFLLFLMGAKKSDLRYPETLSCQGKAFITQSAPGIEKPLKSS